MSDRKPSLEALDALVGDWVLGDLSAPFGTTISGAWETSPDGSSWEHDFDLLYTKVRA